MIKRILLLTTLFFVVSVLQAQMSLEFNTNLSDGTTVTLPLYGTVNVTVEWGDGDTESFTTEGNKDHSYAVDGIYTVTISGTLTHFGANNYPNADKLTKIFDFGDVGLTDLSFSCNNALNLDIVPSQIPSSVTNLSYMFQGANFFNCDIGNWDVSGVTNMSAMFSYCHRFNQNIGDWDVSAVTNMSSMFCYDTSFNHSVGTWDVSNVTDMSQMFWGSRSFNQDIGSWDVSNVTNMSRMFRECYSFNKDIGSWDVSNVADMSEMFSYSYEFNQNIGNWDVSSVTTLYQMFLFCYSFNSNIGDWDVSNVTNMQSMFGYATDFNQDIGDWNVTNLINMQSMFGFAAAFNQNIGDWNVNNVLWMRGLFDNASSFNQDIANWDVSSVVDMNSLFRNATSFDQDIGNWNVSNVTDMRYMFDDVTLSVTNYDSLLIGWAAQNLTPELIFSGGNSKYSCAAVNAHDILSGNPNNWIVTDGGLAEDETNPTISCPSNLTVIADDFSQTYTVQGTELDPLEFTDNCSVSSVLNDFSNSSSLNGSVFDLGTTTVVWTVEDNAGNQSTCSLDVTVEIFIGIENSNSSFSIYPNPSSGLVTIEANNLQNYKTIIISDALGHVVIQTDIDASKISIDLSNQNPGMYFIEIRGEQNSVFEKIVVE